jgi:hypothetical protein
MSLPVTVRSRARIEILEQFYYYTESADLRTANRFLAAIERTASLISRYQGIGRTCDFGISGLKGMRPHTRQRLPSVPPVLPCQRRWH